MKALREKWLQEANVLLNLFRGEAEAKIGTKITLSWDMKADIVEPDVKIAARLPHHAPFAVRSNHKPKTVLTDSNSVAVEAVRELWDEYKGEHGDVLDYQRWVKANVGTQTAELSNAEFAELMRLKRDGPKTNP
jgi:hypothetical protein